MAKKGQEESPNGANDPLDEPMEDLTENDPCTALDDTPEPVPSALDEGDPEIDAVDILGAWDDSDCDVETDVDEEDDWQSDGTEPGKENWGSDERVGLDDGAIFEVDETDDAQWAAMERKTTGNERSELQGSRVIVGLKEFVLLGHEDNDPVVALMDTSRPKSVLYGVLTQNEEGGQPNISVGDVTVVCGLDGDLVQVHMVLAGVARTVRVSLEKPDGEFAMLIGRDLLEGYFVVDVALGFMHPCGSS